MMTISLFLIGLAMEIEERNEARTVMPTVKCMVFRLENKGIG